MDRPNFELNFLVLEARLNELRAFMAREDIMNLTDQGRAVLAEYVQVLKAKRELLLRARTQRGRR